MFRSSICQAHNNLLHVTGLRPALEQEQSQRTGMRIVTKHEGQRAAAEPGR
jgi:hypothetical protein